MRLFAPLFVIALLAINQLFAEGSRQLAPNASINILGNPTSDIAALHINNPSYNNFAAYNNTNPQSRLYIHITDPSAECIYLGFNWAHNNVNTPFPPRISFEYRIKDPDGNIVFGPVTVAPAGANIQNWSQAYTGPMQIHGAGGYDATLVTSSDLESQGWSGKGDYYIEFRDFEGNDLLIDFWDITVVDCSTPTPSEKTGRVWSYNWAIFSINDFGFPNRPFNGAFYVCAPDPDNPSASFITKIDFNGAGFQPAAFNVAFNRFGIQNTGDVSEDRKSVENRNAAQPEYAIFLNDPVDICETAEVGEISILGISRCVDGEYCIKFTTTKAGQIDLLLDFDGPDNIYTPGTADIMVAYTVTSDQVGIPTCIQWDGRDGLGNELPEDISTQIPVTITYAQGIYHFPIYDAELMSNGFIIEAIRPASIISLLYYDDSNITVPSGSGEPVMQISGCITPCHRWTNYTLPDAIGFGNLNTINSWWFSQVIIRQDIFFLPSYYTCEIEGPSQLCQGGTAQLSIHLLVSPVGAAGNEIISYAWTGSGIIGDPTGPAISIGSGGIYNTEVVWVTSLGDTCQNSCSFEVTEDPPLTATIDTLIIQGQVITINGQDYNKGGQYIQLLTTQAGCDSILTINIIVLSTVIYYDLNDCRAVMADGSNMDYSEFIPSYPQPLSCATITADTLYRTNPQMNKHSCTPGVNSSPAMCVSSLDACTYDAGNDVSVVIELTIVPDPDTAVHLTGFTFYEKAPLTYDWINGPTGLNNYPTLYGIRVLKNGIEIYRREDIPTSGSWNEQVFDFLEDDQFLVKDPATFRFELLPYCLVGNGADVAAWDLDEISVVASCASLAGLNKSISGTVTDPFGVSIPNVTIQLSKNPGFGQMLESTTDADGQYIFENLVPENSYDLRGYKNTDFRNGVSTLDLIQIQKHLLGIKPFDSPYQMIAADANKSNGVSAIDLIELRKLILGIYNELPRNTSWRFGITAQELEISNPWMFKESHYIEYLDDDFTGMDFIGVKIGDVNGDALLDAVTPAWTSRTSESLLLNILNQPLSPGIPVIINITSRHFNEIAGLQLAMQLKDMRVREMVSGVLKMSEENYVISPDGVLRVSWTSMIPRSYSPDEVLFSFVVVPESRGWLRDFLHIRHQDLLQPEAYKGDDLQKINIALDLLNTVEENFENHLYQNEPNPFSGSTIIRFQLARSGQATLRIYDLAGRLWYERSGVFNKGENAIEISLNESGVGHGVLVCQLRADGFVASQKMVLLKEE